MGFYALGVVASVGLVVSLVPCAAVEKESKVYRATMAEKSTEEEFEFDWIKLHNEMNASTETQKQKLMRKISENPLIPIGCLATTCALGYGLWSFRTGNRKMSQYMMRTRIAAQGFTVLAMVLGIGLGASKAVK